MRVQGRVGRRVGSAAAKLKRRSSAADRLQPHIVLAPQTTHTGVHCLTPNRLQAPDGGVSQYTTALAVPVKIFRSAPVKTLHAATLWAPVAAVVHPVGQGWQPGLGTVTLPAGLQVPARQAVPHGNVAPYPLPAAQMVTAAVMRKKCVGLTTANR